MSATRMSRQLASPSPPNYTQRAEGVGEAAAISLHTDKHPPSLLCCLFLVDEHVCNGVAQQTAHQKGGRGPAVMTRTTTMFVWALLARTIHATNGMSKEVVAVEPARHGGCASVGWLEGRLVQEAVQHTDMSIPAVGAAGTFCVLRLHQSLASRCSARPFGPHLRSQRQWQWPSQLPVTRVDVLYDGVEVAPVPLDGLLAVDDAATTVALKPLAGLVQGQVHGD
mmetsp:Transcript_4801/g.12922  ORF Transcript_4801/g.12922 Transcript_4801/m.12922 type:complete len:224 (+) Transcript_4801:123-794(+)